MRKRYMTTLIICLLVFIFAAAPLSAQYRSRARSSRLGFGLGIPNAVLVYRPGSFDFKGGYDFTEGKQFIFLSGDYRLVNNRRLTDLLHLSIGAGVYGKAYLEAGSNDDFLEGGLRIPFGLSILVLNNFLEFFLEIAPGIDLYPNPKFSSQPIQIWAGLTIELD